MKSVVEYINQKPMIKRAETFCSLALNNNKLPDNIPSFNQLLKNMDNIVKKEHPKVTSGALSNCHGDWYEWIIAILANNYYLEEGSKYLILQLPNIRQFDVSTLYQDKLFSYIKDLRTKISQNSNVNLISSNPDFVIIDTENIDLNGFSIEKIEHITPDKISNLEKLYTFFTGKCEFENIVGYLSVKTSLRPDRRLQISHEGSLMKALYVHLQTREWIINPRGLVYYAAATAISDADRAGLKTVATHSITNVQNKPEAAVDEVYKIDSIEDAHKAFKDIM